MRQIDRCVYIEYGDSPDSDIFFWWTEWLAPMFPIIRNGKRLLMNRTERKILAEILRRRAALPKTVKDENEINRLTTSLEVFENIQNVIGTTKKNMFQARKTLELRKVIAPHYKLNGRISHYRINEVCIPDLNKDGKYRMMILFKKKEADNE